MPNQEPELGLLQTQVQTNVSFTSFMTAVVVFFTGLLLTRFDSFDISIKIPLSFLIISIFGFLYSTLIYANASEEVSQGRVMGMKKFFLLGDIFSEYLGIYLLILSIPMVINVVTGDNFLRIVTLLASLGGLGIYQFSHLSILERHFDGRYRIISVIMLLFGLTLYYSQIYAFYFSFFAAAFLVFILSLTFFATRK